MPENFYNPYCWLYAFVCFPQGLVTYWAYSRCFKLRFYSVWSAIIVATISFMFVVPQTFFEIYIPFKPFILYSLIFLTLLSMKEKTERSGKVFIFFALNVFADMLLELLIMLVCVAINFIDFEKGTGHYDFKRVMATLFFTLGSILVKYLLIVVWKRFVNKDSTAKLRLAHLLFPLAQFLCVIAIAVEHSSTGYIEQSDTHFGMNTSVIIVITIIVFAIADFAYLFYISDIEKKYELESELKIREQAHDLEEKHYQTIVEKRYEVAKIRHDFNNQLMVVRSLITDGKIREADDFITEMAEQISKTNEYEYSSIPVLNALISEKMKVAQKQNTTLSSDISIPEDCQIPHTKLLSVFSNLVDNALKATAMVEDSKREINIHAVMNNNILAVKCTNTLVTENKHTSLKHRDGGYGLRILEDIAREYNGDFSSEIKDGICTCKIIMSAK